MTRPWQFLRATAVIQLIVNQLIRSPLGCISLSFSRDWMTFAPRVNKLLIQSLQRARETAKPRDLNFRGQAAFPLTF